MISLDNRCFEEATASFEEVLEMTPDYGPALLNLGFIAKTAGESEKAEGLYRRLIEVDPDGIEARANLGHLLLALERPAEAAATEHADKGLRGIVSLGGLRTYSPWRTEALAPSTP